MSGTVREVGGAVRRAGNATPPSAIGGTPALRANRVDVRPALRWLGPLLALLLFALAPTATTR